MSKNILILIPLLVMGMLNAQEFSMKSIVKKHSIELKCELSNHTGSILVLGLPVLLNVEDTIKKQPYFIDDYGVFFRLDTLKRFTMKMIIDTAQFQNRDSIEIFLPIENPLNKSSNLYIVLYKNGKTNWTQGPEHNSARLAGGRNRIRTGVKQYTARL